MKPPIPNRSLDVRSLSSWDRHARIFATFDALSDGTTLTIGTDHEPRPLRLEVEQRDPDIFVGSVALRTLSPENALVL